MVLEIIVHSHTAYRVFTDYFFLNKFNIIHNKARYV